MKSKPIATILACLLLGGCATATKALRITQEIEGSGSITISSPIRTTTVAVVNARQENGRFRADKLDLVSPNLEIHVTDYSRPVIPPKANAK